jgi:mannose-1-phosphate guanylyltransferase/mannose-6-phosphate isomerase
MYNFAVILAGGIGSRLFPLSRVSYPKQFLKIFNNKSLLRLTYERILNNFDDILICSTFNYKHLIEKENIDKEKIILEPESVNTAGAILLSVKYVLFKYNLKEANFIFLPSDHFIFNKTEFLSSLKKGLDYTSIGVITIGVKPDHPSTNYGYIKLSNLIEDNVFKVEKFIEKPNKSKAKYYLKSNNYLWNSGIYIFNSSFLLEDFYQINSDFRSYINFSYQDLLNNYKSIPKISIDYAYSEKSQNLLVVKSNFRWSDVGTFEEISKIYQYLETNETNNYNSDNKNNQNQNNQDQNNQNQGNGVFKINSNSFLIKDNENLKNKKYCFIDCNDLIVVDTSDFLLVSKKNSSFKIKDILNKIDPEVLKYNVFDYRPWGYYKELDKDLNKYRVKFISVYPKQELSLQYHNFRKEYWFILKGSGVVIINDKEILVKENDIIDIPYKAAHSIKNTSDIDLEFIEIQVGEKLLEDDIVRIRDIYQRV